MLRIVRTIATALLAFAVLVGISTAASAIVFGHPSVSKHVDVVDPSTVEWSLELAQNGYQNAVRPIMPEGMTNEELNEQFADTCLFLDAGYTVERIEQFWANKFTLRQAKGMTLAAAMLCGHASATDPALSA